MRVVFAAGGTGGHINPALSVAEEFRKIKPDSEILFIGTKDKMEAELVPLAGFDFKTIEISGFQRKPSFNNIKRNMITLIHLKKSLSDTKKIFKEFKPDIVVGFGGYVSGPVVRAASKMAIKTAIHEQNAFPGITNKSLAKSADIVMLTVEDAKKHLKCKNPPVVTGLPVRDNILTANKAFARASLGIKDHEFLVVSTGGSLGAKRINEVMVELIAELHNIAKFHFIHGYGQYGKWVPDKLKSMGVDLEKTKNIELKEYIYDMASCLAAADLVISRAGASSLSEIEALGKASILVPSPNVAENHQYFNALSLTKNDAAILIEEKDISGEVLVEQVKRLSEDEKFIRVIENNAKQMAITDAKSRICDIIIKIANS